MKVLLVDRVKVFQHIISEILHDSGITYDFAFSGNNALELLEQDEFQCICVSMYLDDMNGIELCQKLRKIERYLHTPIVLLTTENSEEVFNHAITSGITDVFQKDKIHELINFIDRFTKVNKPLHGSVLYIEDQKSQRDYVSMMFQARNLQVDAFDNAEEAWKMFLKNDYHLVITDIVLKGPISGIILINKIRRLEGKKGDTPILAITAFDDISRRINLYHMGITDYVTKPIIEEELVARVRNLIKNQTLLDREIKFKERLNSQEMIKRSQKMEALAQLIGGIAHDYNNLLGIISGYSELLENKLANQPDLLNYVVHISNASKNSAILTNKLLSFTRKDKTDNEEIVLINKLIENTQSMLMKSLSNKINFKTILEDNLWSIFIDVNDFENALINMCINAKHAMKSEGNLTISTSNKHLPLSISETLGLPEGDYVLFSIKDSGVGMDMDVQSRIFDPFYSTKGTKGTGLGLSQVYSFVLRSNGAIIVDSKLGQGTTFKLYFPRKL